MRLPLLLISVCIPASLGMRIFDRLRGIFSRGTDEPKQFNFWSSVREKISKKSGVSPTWTLFTEDRDTLEETIEGEKYALTPLTTTSSSSIWFAVSRKTPKVLKVSNNCNDLTLGKKTCSLQPSTDPLCNSDPIMKEFKIMNTLGKLRNAIVPHADQVSTKEFFIGHSSQLQLKVLGPETAPPNAEIWTSCAVKNASYRAILEDLVGDDFVKAVSERKKKQDEKVAFQEMIMMTRRTIGLLWRFHDLGLIHGDIHSGNVAFKYKDGSQTYSALTDEMVLIDFGLSRFIVNQFGTSEYEKVDSSIVSPLWMSQWQHQNKRIGRRDDLARAMQVLIDSFTTYGGVSFLPEYPAMTESDTDGKKASLKSEWEKRVLRKKSTYLFSTEKYGGKFKFLPGFMDALRNLDIALNLIRKISHVDSRPPYERIIGALDRAILYSTCAGDFNQEKVQELHKMLAHIWESDTMEFELDELTSDRGIGVSRDPKLEGKDAMLAEYLAGDDEAGGFFDVEERYFLGFRKRIVKMSLSSICAGR